MKINASCFEDYCLFLTLEPRDWYFLKFCLFFGNIFPVPNVLFFILVYGRACTSSELKMLDSEFFLEFTAMRASDKLEEFKVSRAKSAWGALVENMFS